MYSTEPNKNGKVFTIIGNSLGRSVLIGLAAIAWNALRSDIADNRAEIRELRRDVYEIQKLAAERGKTIPDLERRIERLERRRNTTAITPTDAAAVTAQSASTTQERKP